jgi:DNA-binding FadR family transcriptional regulator
VRQAAAQSAPTLQLQTKAAKTMAMKRQTKLLPQNSALTPPKRSLRIHGTIARQLGIAIVSGRYAPGEILEGEVVSSEQFSVSRTAYREALRILAAKGLIDARPKVGTRINPRTQWNFLDTDVLEWIFETEPDAHTLNALFELRDLVEPAAAALAATRRTSNQLVVLRQALDDMRLHTLATEAGQNADLAFHATLLQATHNPFLISLATSVGAAIHITTMFKQRNQPLRRDPTPDHERVYQAIAKREPARARAAMRGLIRLARIDTAVGAKRRKRSA